MPADKPGFPWFLSTAFLTGDHGGESFGLQDLARAFLAHSPMGAHGEEVGMDFGNTERGMLIFETDDSATKIVFRR